MKHALPALTTLACALSLGAALAAPSTLTVWTWRAQDAPLWKQVQAKLNQEGYQVHIDFRSINPTSYDSVLATAMDSGKGPDIFYGRAGEGTFNYAASKLIVPVNGLVSFKNFVPSSLAAVHYQGKNWGVPLDEEAMVIFYNKQIFKTYHLSPPKTWNDFLTILKTLKSHGVTPISIMPIQTWLVALTIDEISATMLGNQGAKSLVARKMTYNSKPYIDVLKKLVSLEPYFEPNYMAVGSAGNEQEIAIATGQAAMVFDGIYDLGTMEQFGAKQSNLGIFAVPPMRAGQPSRVDWYPDATLVENAKIANPAARAAANAALKFATTKQFGSDFAGIAGEISPIKGVTIPAKYVIAREAYALYQKEPLNPLIGIRSPMDTPPPTGVNSSSQKVNTDVGIFTAETNEVQPLLSGKITPAQAAAAIQKAVSWYFAK
jgi:multiple sugar transport system substrate-binding protein/raffinose/stachyose/melibiose transport system substrate-binding protein